tara:strand:- start:455 stop:814 length:360 start_codon:yes stop_codon:yes gene_type:complete
MNSKIIEGLSGCSGSKKNAIYRQSALIDRLFSELNTVKAEFSELEQKRNTNTGLILANKVQSKGAISDINEKKKEKEKELDDLEKGESPPPGAAPIPKNVKIDGKYGAAMKKSAGSGRF